MFRTNSNEDRINYSQLLLPPPGFVLDQAIGTTYSLDLETLTAVCIALGLGEDMDSELLRDPLSMLYALRKTAEKVLIFCEAGQIKASDTNSPLMILLERMVIPVALPKGKKKANYPSFHPKTWIIQYANSDNKEEKKYRFVVLSRNLTFDRSWDVSFFMDGSKGYDHPEKTAPIISFLNYLRDRIGDGVQDSHSKKRVIKDLAKELRTVSFALEDQGFWEDFTVMPLGIGAGSSYNLANDPLLCEDKGSRNYSFQDLVVFSPFLSGSLIDYWNKEEHSLSETHRTLITRRSELPKLTAEQTSRFKVFVLKDGIVEGEEYISESVEDKQRQDIHAKIYLRKKYAEKELYLGSMNASDAAIHQNVEMMIRLDTKSKKINGELFLRELFCGDADGAENPFQEVLVQNEIADDSEDETKRLERTLKDICRRKMQASITENNGKYDVLVSVPGVLPEEWRNVTVAPLRRDTFNCLKNNMVFPEMEIIQLTEFYRIRNKGKNGEQITRIIMIPTSGFPEERESAVIDSVVKGRFTEYVALILGDNYLMTMLEERRMTNSSLWGSDSASLSALYEKMLTTALNDPERFDEIDSLLQIIKDKETIPDDFLKLYEVFRTIIPPKKKRGKHGKT